MQKRKKVPAPTKVVFIACRLSPDLLDSLKLLSASRKARGTYGEPSFINAILDDAIARLAAMVKSGADVGFIPCPRSNSGRTSFRISATSHRLALRACENADVKLSDFVRTAVNLYVRSHANELYKEAKAPSRRGWKSTRD